ncbi:DUF6380 family protein [Streptomyces sp. NPDC005017]|uniref:DUF6380 family protein n=1 Tax=Streptomyces sp. NPDC005017 TaxID=3364706 RepID=UPI0036CD5ABE
MDSPAGSGSPGRGDAAGINREARRTGRKRCATLRRRTASLSAAARRAAFDRHGGFAGEGTR